MAREFWNYVDCIKNKNLALIETSLTEILIKEDFKKISNLPDSFLTEGEDMNFYSREERYWQLIREVLLIGLFPGDSDWTFVKTQPREFLCRRSKNNLKPRLSELATQIKSKAFHWSTYQDNYGILLEADEKSNVFVSGSHFTSDESEKNLFYQETINYNEEWKFHLLNISEEIREAIKPETREEFENQMIRLNELYTLFNQGIDTFDEIMELTIGMGTIADTSFWRSIGNSSQYWRKSRLCNITQKEEERIIADGGRLLYFQTPKYYQQLES